MGRHGHSLKQGLVSKRSQVLQGIPPYTLWIRDVPRVSKTRHNSIASALVYLLWDDPTVEGSLAAVNRKIYRKSSRKLPPRRTDFRVLECAVLADTGENISWSSATLDLHNAKLTCRACPLVHWLYGCYEVTIDSVFGVNFHSKARTFMPGIVIDALFIILVKLLRLWRS